jgi:hypothetical protein
MYFIAFSLTEGVFTRVTNSFPRSGPLRRSHAARSLEPVHADHLDEPEVEPGRRRQPGRSAEKPLTGCAGRSGITLRTQLLLADYRICCRPGRQISDGAAQEIEDVISQLT